MTDPALLQDPELDELLLAACAQRLGIAGALPPAAVDPQERNKMSAAIKGQKDPADGTSLSVGFCWAVFEPDERGLQEVLLTTSGAKPYTAFVNEARDVVYLEEGW